MKTHSSSRKCGFSLIETVIAIGVLAVLLTGFIIVFAPAAAGIKKSINLQAADRLASTLEQELVTWRTGDPGTTGFEKAFEWIKSSNAGSADNALLAYEYRGSLTTRRPDGTPLPLPNATTLIPGKDYMVQSTLRRKSDSKFLEDLVALEGGVYLVKGTQFVFDADGKLILGTPGQIADPKNSATVIAAVDLYPEAVIAFSAEFYSLPQKSKAYFEGQGFSDTYSKVTKPVFTRNLAARR